MDGDPIHQSLHTLIAPVYSSRGGKSMGRVKDPRVGWVKSMGRGDKGLSRRMKYTLKEYYILIDVVTYLKMKNSWVG